MTADQRIDRLEERMDKLEEKVEKQNIEAAETRVYVKEIYKKLDDLKTDLAAISKRQSQKDEESENKNNDRWAKIVERAFWAIVTIVGYFVGKGGT